MGTTFRRFDRLLPAYRTRHGPEVSALALAAGLLVGLVGIVPTFTALVREFSVSLPLPELLGVGVVLFAYTAAVVVLRRVLLGAVVSLVVLSTFAANLPLTAGATAYPGELGPQIWLFELPLLALFGYLVKKGYYARESFDLPEVAFGLFVVWSVLSAVLGDPLRPSTALYYALFVAVVWITFTVIARTIRARIIDFRTLTLVFVLTVCAQALFAVAEFLNQAPFGLTYLGETHRSGGSDALTTGLFDGYTIGVLASGFTGGSGPLSALLVLATPIAFAFAFDRRGWQRLPPLAIAALSVAVIRLTGKDAARIAVLVGLALFCALWVWTERESIAREPLRNAGIRLVPVACAFAVAIVTVLLPSKTSGVRARNVGSSTGSTSATESSLTAPPTGGDSAASSVDVASLSIPYISLNSLGIRLKQYVAGVDMAIKHPLFGIGGANYPYVAPRYGLPAHLGSGWFPLHNQYVAVLAETGVVGFLAYATAIVAVLRDSWRSIRTSAGEVVHLGVFSGLVGFLAVAFWVVNVRYVMMLPFWILAGAVIGCKRTEKNR